MQVEVSVHIQAKLEDIFTFITDFEKNPLWQKGMVSCTFITEPPLRVGSQYRQVAQFMGRDVISLFEVKQLIPNERVKFETIESTFPIQIIREVIPRDEGTLVHAVISGQPKGLMNLFTPLVKIMMKRSIEADYLRLKQLFEKESV